LEATGITCLCPALEFWATFLTSPLGLKALVPVDTVAAKATANKVLLRTVMVDLSQCEKEKRKSAGSGRRFQRQGAIIHHACQVLDAAVLGA
jgi:hypothetical protein